MRSAEAARNTSLLIEDTVKEVRGGAEIVTQVNETFISFGRDTLKINDLISEISLASDKRAKNKGASTKKSDHDIAPQHLIPLDEDDFRDF